MKTLFALLLLFSLPAFGGETVYKCIDDGVSRYSDKPCGRHSKKLVFNSRISRGSGMAFAEALVREVENYVHSARSDTMAQSYPLGTRAVSSPSFRCVSDTGYTFYRHDGCPGAIPGYSYGRVYDPETRKEYFYRQESPDRVRAIPVKPSDACLQIYSFDRDDPKGLDQDYSTYDRNLGRDPCR